MMKKYTNLRKLFSIDKKFPKMTLNDSNEQKMLQNQSKSCQKPIKNTSKPIKLHYKGTKTNQNRSKMLRNWILEHLKIL